MKVSSLLLFISLSSPTLLLAQISPIISNTANDVTDILTNKGLQQDLEIAKNTSALEDLTNDNSCGVEIDSQPTCQGFANSLMPEKYKDKGWKSLLEIKYQPISKPKSGATARANFSPINLSFYRSNNQLDIKELKTKEDIEGEVVKITNWYKENYYTTLDPFNLQTNLIIEQFNNPQFFPATNTLKQNNDLMFSRMGELTKSMSDQDYLRFVSAMAGYVDYNDERAGFVQQNGAGLGIVTPFEQLSNSKSGVCGDIHSMAAKLGELRGWESFTVGYSLEGMQHVVTAMVNPNDPNNLKIVNYGNYEEHALNDGNSVKPVPNSQGGSWSEIGMQMRIFKNDKTGDPLGKMQQIATVPTALGSFMSDLFKKDYQISKAMPQNQNYRLEKVGGENSQHKLNTSVDGKKLTDKLVGEGLVVYEGETDNAHIYGIAVSHNVYKDLYRYDAKEGKCVLKKNKYFSIGIAGSLIDLNQAKMENTFYAYLNMKGGEIFHVYQSEHFQFKGVIGYELEGFASTYNNQFLTGDGNFTTLMGVIADYQNKGTVIHTALTYESTIGLRNQNLMTDFKSLPTNLNPMNFNALSLDANLIQKINDKTTFVTNNNFSLTRVGGRVLLSTGLIHKNTSIMASYQGGVRPLKIGNTLQDVNLLQNFNNMDGFRLSATQSFTNKNGSLSGSISGYGGISTSTVSPMPMAGASLKINLNGKKRAPAQVP